MPSCPPAPPAPPQVDLSSGATQLWHVPAHYPGEPIFCAAPDEQREDDGVLLSVVLAGEAGGKRGGWVTRHIPPGRGAVVDEGVRGCFVAS